MPMEWTLVKKTNAKNECFRSSYVDAYVAGKNQLLRKTLLCTV